jgi:hypothetical protein
VGFWHEVAAGFLGNMAAAMLITMIYVIIQWFLAATDIVISYNWSYDGTQHQANNFRPNFDIRNRSRSKTYYLANIQYSDDGKMLWIDNKSVLDVELKAGTIRWVTAGPVKNLHAVPVSKGLQTEVHVRLQNGRAFWLKGQGPGQLRMGRIQRTAFRIRNALERWAVPTE